MMKLHISGCKIRIFFDILRNQLEKKCNLSQFLIIQPIAQEQREGEKWLLLGGEIGRTMERRTYKCGMTNLGQEWLFFDGSMTFLGQDWLCGDGWYDHFMPRLVMRGWWHDQFMPRKVMRWLRHTDFVHGLVMRLSKNDQFVPGMVMPWFATWPIRAQNGHAAMGGTTLSAVRMLAPIVA